MNYRTLLCKPVFAAIISPIWIFAFTSSAVPQARVAEPREERLLNGLKLLMFDAPASDKVTLKVRIHAGSAFDPQGKEGVMKLLAANIFPNPEAKEFFAEQLGGSLDIESGYDYIQVNAASKPESILTMLETVATAIANMDIDKETTSKLKTVQLKNLESMMADPSFIADQAASARLLGAFPYGRPADGTRASIERIDFADLLAAKQRFLTSDNATVLIAGKFDPTLAYRAVRRYFGAWLKSDKRVPATFRQPDEPPQGVQFLESPVSDRTEIRFVTRGTSRSSNDFAAYRIAAEVLKARLRSFLPAAESSSINVKSFDHILPGTFAFRFSGSKALTASTAQTNELILKSLSTPVTEAEFQPAKQAEVAEFGRKDVLNLWLDIDTYKTETPSKLEARWAATTLGDVQNVLSRIKSQPIVGVTVSSAKTVQ